MKNGSNRWIKIFISIIVCSFFLGYNIFETIPKLINADKPFIELSGSIGESVGNATEAYKKANPTPVPTLVPTVTPTPEITQPPVVLPEKENVVVLVGEELIYGSGEIIFVNGTRVDTVKELKIYLSNPEYEEKEFLLIDYYAENNTFREVKTAMEELGIIFRIEMKIIEDSENS